MAQTFEIPPDWPAWKREIAEEIHAKNLSMKEVSLRAGLGETWVRDALKRDKEPTVKNLEKVKTVLGLSKSSQPRILRVGNLPVIGRAQAGAFLDVSVFSQDEDYETVPVAQIPRYAHANQYALRTVGDSMNKIFDEDSYVICASWGDLGLAFRPGMCLHVERHEGPLVEVTVKCYDIEDGKRMLFPRSTNPAHKPIPLDDRMVVKGLIIGVYKPFEF